MATHYNEHDNQETIDPNQTTKDILTYNVSLLTTYSVNQYNNLYDMNLRLIDENKKLEDDIIELKKRKRDSEKHCFKLEQILDKQKEVKNVKVTKTEYKIKKYRKTKNSYDDMSLKRIIINIKTIKDIINLENNWNNIKHHIQLQKLYLLIKPLKKLNNMIGLSNIKQEVMKKIIYYLQNPNNDEYLHTILSGPPGVGKTEVAKIYAEIFQNLGILKNNSFIEVKRDELVGEYLGQTAPKTRKALESAMGGVIFIDEAYSLGNSEKRDSFSKECIDMINQYLSEYKNDFMMIVAGYDEELNKCFFAYNPGLRRRFSTYFNIEGYDSDELMEIFKLKVNSFNYKNKINDNKLNKFFKDNKKNFKHYGGDIEKLVNELKYVQANRTFYQDDQNNKDITIDDLDEAFNNFNRNNNTEKEASKPPIGMYL